MSDKVFKRIIGSSVALSLVMSNATVLNAQNSLIPKSSFNIEDAVSTDPSGKLQSLKDILEKSKTDFKGYSANDIVSFIVELDGESLLDTKPDSKTMQQYLETSAGKEAQNKIKTEQKGVKSKMLKARSANLTVEYTYSVVLNGFAVRAPFSAKEMLESIPGVKSVTVSKTYEYVEPVEGYTEIKHSSGEMMDSDRANAEGYTGKGVVTAVLDTGLDITHEAFQKDPVDPSMSLDDVETLVSTGTLNANADASELYRREKIPFAYDYADNDSNVLGDEHGHHVSGTVAAKGDQFTGVAPDTQLVFMKVFSDKQKGADDKWVFAALEDCILLNVDTINMSLGSPSGFTSDSVADEVYNKVKKAGINLMCSAGNDYDSTFYNNLGTDMALVSEPDNGIVGSPSTYNAPLSVASINENQIFATYLLAGNEHLGFNDGNSGTKTDFVETLDGKDLEYVVVPNFGSDEDYADIDVNGKIALVSRGNLDFTQKEENAYNHGAVAMIVYNNVEGESINMMSKDLIPMVFISKADGDYLKSLEDKIISVSKDYQEFITDNFCGLMSDFSSLGVTPDLKLKPEITAPGGNVYSTLPGNKYGNMSGTSMASPHMAGAASVVRQYVAEKFPYFNKVDQMNLINTLLMNTAVPAFDETGEVPYTPRKQGAGLAEVYNAIHTDVYVTVDGNERPKAELGDSPDGSFNKSFTIKLHNISDTDKTYNMNSVSLAPKTEMVEGYYDVYECISTLSRVLEDNEFEVSFSQNEVTVPANETASVTVYLKLTEVGKESLSVFTNGIYLDGFIGLESTEEDGIDLSIPYLGFYGDWGKASVFDDSIYDEEDASVYPSRVALIDLLSGYGNELGVNVFADYLYNVYLADEDKISIASHDLVSVDSQGNLLSYNTLFSFLGLLRAPDSLEYTISDEEGNIFFKNIAEHPMKSFYYGNDGFMTYDMGPTYNGWDAVFEYDGQYYYVPDGDYIYEVTAKVAGTNSETGTQTVTYPITIDNSDPQLVATEYFVEDGVPYLAVTITDNHYLQVAQLCKSDGDPLANPIIIDENEKNAVTTLYFDISYIIDAGIETATIDIIDYAMNETISEEFRITSDKSALQAAIDDANGRKEEAYTPNSWKEMQPVLEAALAVVDDLGATQEEVDAATKALVEALEALVVRADVTGLKALVEEVEALDKEIYTPKSWEDSKVEEALANAKAVLENPNATEEEVKVAVETLKAAEDALIEKADKEELHAVYDKGQKVDEKAYTKESYQALQEALSYAKEVLDDPNASQEEVDKMVKVVNTTYDSLVKLGNTSQLADLIGKAESEDLSKYEDESASTIKEAIDAAKEVLGKPSTQEELDKAYKALKEALAKATKKPVKEEQAESSNTSDNMNLGLYTMITLLSAGGLLFVIKKRKALH